MPAKKPQTNAAAAGEDSLSEAVAKGDVQKATKLLEQGLCTPDELGDYLFKAAQAGKTAVAQLLIDRGADVNARGFEGRTALMAAARKGKFDIVAALLKASADVHSLCKERELAPVDHAAFCQTTAAGKIIDALVAAGGNLKRHPVLAIACMHGHVSSVQALIALGADVNELSVGGTPLIYAIEYTPQPNSPGKKVPRLDVIALLLAAGADSKLVYTWPEKQIFNRTYVGKSALDLARERSLTDVIALLEK